jgi:hypothetical protein
MIEKTYRCDLCRFAIDDAGADFFHRGGIGIYWKGEEIMKKDVGQSEHHLCDECVKALVVMLVTTKVATPILQLADKGLKDQLRAAHADLEDLKGYCKSDPPNDCYWQKAAKTQDVILEALNQMGFWGYGVPTERNDE